LRHRLVALIVLSVIGSGCAAVRAFRKGEEASRAGDWDAAVTYFTKAVQEDPNKAEYKIPLERATQTASRIHLARGVDLESKDQLDFALIEYKKAVELDPTNRLAAGKVAATEKTIRDRIEASRPKPAINALMEQARLAATPTLNPTSPMPVVNFNNSSLRDILNFIGTTTGINITYDQTYQDKAYTVHLEDVSLVQALQQILSANQLFYKILNPKTIIVIPDTAAKHAQYDDLVVRVFFVSHADVSELAQLLNTIMRIPTMPVQPTLLPNKAANTITVRATAAVVDVIERIIRANDKPRAEVIVDVQILEVNKKRTRDFGLNLSNYSVGVIFSPETAPSTAAGAGNPTFNLNTISQGVSTADFYLTVPTAAIKFLEQDSRTKLIAKPQLRGAEGTKLTLNLGDQIPVISTVFGAAAPGGFASVPQSSYNYKDVGVNVEMTPRVTYEGDIILDGLTVESSALGPSINVGGQDAPSFTTRKITTKLRLREGESNLLAGLLRDEQRKILTGLPGLTRTPVIRTLFGSTNDEITQSDIVMLLTPHIVRTHELTAEDLAPMFIGTQQNVGLGGPPPLIAPQGAEQGGAAPAAAPAGAPGAQPVGPGAQPPAVPTMPPGTFPTPQVVTPLPTAPPAAAPGAVPPGGVPPGAAAPGTVPPATPPGTTPPTTAPGAPGAKPPAGTEPVPPLPTAPPRDPNAPPLPTAPAAPPGGAAQLLITPPGTEFRVAGGPYTVPISINNVSRLSTMTLTVTFNPNVLRVRQVTPGTFMRQGAVIVTFTPNIDAAGGRVDIAQTRTSDQTGASGTGLLAALIFDAVGPGSSTIQVNGIASTPEGGPIPIQVSPVAITVR
jgi:general secretion pathway protein D